MMDDIFDNAAAQPPVKKVPKQQSDVSSTAQKEFMAQHDFIKDELFASETKVKRESSKVQEQEVIKPNRRKAQNLIKAEKPEKPKVAP